MTDNFCVHPSKVLQHLYLHKHWQGQDPLKASIFFIGLDANWDKNLEKDNPFMFEKVVSYLKDGVKFWEEEGVHHPFLLPEYKKKDGYRFHKNFSKLYLDIGFAKAICFLELLDTPTCGISSRNSSLFNSMISKDHLERVSNIILSDKRKLVFISRSVYRRIKKLDSKSGLFKFGLEPDSLSGEEFVNIHNQNNTFIFVCNHFSACNTNLFYKDLSKIIKSFILKDKSVWWRVSYVGSWNGDRVEETRYIKAKDIFGVKDVLCKHLNPFRVEHDFSQLNFKPVDEQMVDERLIWS